MKGPLTLVFVLFFTLLVSSTAFSQSLDLQKMVDEKAEALELLPVPGPLRLVRFRTVLEFGLKVPVLASFNLNPEIELFFTKN